MCRHAQQRPRTSSACFATSQACFATSQACLQRPRHAFLQGPRSSTSKKNPPTCCQACLGVAKHAYTSQVPTLKGPFFLYGSLVVHYFLGFTAYKAASWGGVSSMWDSQDLAKMHAEDVTRTLQACLGRCKACLGRCQACLGATKHAQELQTCLHILGSHIKRALFSLWKLGGTLLPWLHSL